MANNFGAGYPGKTWKEAAAEVAWNRIKEFSEIFYFHRYVRLDFRPFFKEEEAMTVCHFPDLTNDHSFIFDRAHTGTFPAFRAAFMEWLDKNEVKK